MATKVTKQEHAEALARGCEDSYSFDRYASWTAVAAALLRMGLTEKQAEAVMRSKWTRWAADAHGTYDNVPAKAIVAFTEKQGMDEVRKLTLGTFGVEE
jgi:hypothetical protein